MRSPRSMDAPRLAFAPLSDGLGRHPSGAYRAGSSAEVDEAIALHKPLEAFLSQSKEEATIMADGYDRLEGILRGEETQN
jgi:hypothetical protein